MGGNFFHNQAIRIHNLGARGIQADGQIANRKRFVRAKGLLIGKRSVFTDQQIYKARGLREKSRAVRAEHAIYDWSVTGKCARVEESREVSAVIDMKMGQQNRIYIIQVQVQFSDAQEAARSSIDQNPGSSAEQHEVT